MPSYRGFKRQALYRGGVPQVAYRNGVKVHENLAQTCVVEVEESTSSRGYRSNVNPSIGDIDIDISVTDIIDMYVLLSFDIFQITYDLNSTFENDNIVAILTRLDTYDQVVLDPSASTRFSKNLGRKFFEASDVGNDVPFNIAFRFTTDWSPARFASTRVGFASGQGSMVQTKFLMYLIENLYSNEASGTTLLEFNNTGDEEDPELGYVFTVIQRDTGGNILGQGEFFGGILGQWICDQAFLQEVYGSIEIYQRVPAAFGQTHTQTVADLGNNQFGSVFGSGGGMSPLSVGGVGTLTDSVLQFWTSYDAPIRTFMKLSTSYPAYNQIKVTRLDTGQFIVLNPTSYNDYESPETFINASDDGDAISLNITLF